MSIASMRKLKKGDSAVLYVTTCSDIDSSFKYCRRFLECQVVGVICSWRKSELDDRYIVRCAEDLRDEPYKGGIYAYEALVSAHSPFLFTWKEFEKLKSNPKNLQNWLDSVEDLMMGFDVPSRMRNWQMEVCRIMLGLGIDDASGIIADIREDFSPEKMRVISFPY